MNIKKPYIIVEMVILFFIGFFFGAILFGPGYVEVLGKKYKSDIQVLDLSKETIGTDYTWENKLRYFRRLDSVLLGNENTIPIEEKERLNKTYPALAVQAISTYSLYGKAYREDATSLNFSDVFVDESIKDNLKYFYNVKEVYLYNQNLSDEFRISLLEEYPDIQFYWNVNVFGTKIDSASTYLDFTGHTVDDFDQFVIDLKLLNKLEKLEMGESNLSHDELGHLRELFPNIEINWVIHMGVWTLRTDDVAFSVLISNFPYTKLRTDDIQVLKYCTKLQALDLGHQGLTDLSVIGDYLTNLRVLILADNKITDITPLSKLTHLHYVELQLNFIADPSPLAQCTELVDVNLSHNPTLTSIMSLTNLPMIERFWCFMDAVPWSEKEIIKQSYPNAELVLSGWGSTNYGWRLHERYFAMIDMYHNNYISSSFSKYDK